MFQKTAPSRSVWMTALAVRGSVSDESQMLTGDANIIEVGVVILWNIDDAKKYVFNIRDQEGTIKKVAESALREVVGQNDLWPIVTGNRGDVGANVKKIMQGHAERL